jgi:hypothetical protein
LMLLILMLTVLLAMIVHVMIAQHVALGLRPMSVQLVPLLVQRIFFHQFTLLMRRRTAVVSPHKLLGLVVEVVLLLLLLPLRNLRLTIPREPVVTRGRIRVERSLLIRRVVNSPTLRNR